MESEMLPVQMNEQAECATVREGGRSYLLLPEAVGADDPEEWEQFTALNIRGLLRCKRCCRDGKNYLSYDITGKQSISEYYKEREIGFEDCRSILMSMDRIFRQMYECLLPEENLQILPDRIYIGMEEKEVWLVYGRESGEGFPVQMKHFAEYVLDHIDYKDERAATLAHQFYKYAMAESFNMEEFLSENRKYLNPEETGTESETEECIQDEEREVYEAGERYYELWISRSEEGNMAEENVVNKSKQAKRGKVFWVCYIIPMVLLGICFMGMENVRIWLAGGGTAYVSALILYHINCQRRSALKEKEEAYYMENRGRANTPLEN